MNRRTLGVLAIVAAAVLVLSLYALRTEQAGPGTGALATATPTPAATVTATPTAAFATVTTSPAASPTAVPTATGTAAEEYGYVFIEDQRIVVRRESDGMAAFELAGVHPAVSPDGKRLAYWRTAGDVNGIDLRVVEVGDPSSDRSVLAVDDQTFGGAVVWSNDGLGLLVATYSRESLGPLGGPAHYDLFMLELSATPPTARPAAPRITGGRVYVPTLWHRAGQMAAAIITGEGGFTREYVTWDGNAASPFARREIGHLVLAQSVQPSPDAELLLARGDDGSLYVWYVDDATIFEVERPGRIGLTPMWRPGACTPCQAIVTVGRNVDTFFWETDRSATLYTSSVDQVGSRAMRPDGSAVLITERIGGGPAPAVRLLLLDMATGQTREIATLEFDREILPRGVVLR